MKEVKVVLINLVLIALLGWIIQPVLAGVNLRPADVINIYTGQTVTSIVAPQKAVDNSQAIVPLGSALDNGRQVEGYAIIHYKKGYHHRPSHGNGGSPEPTASCYSFLAKGARWKTTEPYVAASGIDASAVARDLDAWDSQVGFEIFGSQDMASIVDGPDTIAPDYKNEIMFGDIDSPGAIAVAIVWGIFIGPPQGRELVEYDVVFDNVDYVWGDATIDSAVMDFENIATHEFGHAAGLADLYELWCGEQTMYGYANYGETKKRTLEIGDINGLKKLYQ